MVSLPVAVDVIKAALSNILHINNELDVWLNQHPMLQLLSSF